MDSGKLVWHIYDLEPRGSFSLYALLPTILTVALNVVFDDPGQYVVPGPFLSCQKKFKSLFLCCQTIFYDKCSYALREHV